MWAALFLCAATLSGEDVASRQWCILIEPKFVKHPFAWPIPGSRRAELVPALWREGEFIFPARNELALLQIDLAGIREAALRNASAALKDLKPEFVRNSENVIEYATLASDHPLTASTILAPDFLKMFQPVFGPKVLVAIPNRYCLFIFPALAGDYRDNASMVLDSYKRSAYPVSTEVFELSRAGLRAVGIYEAP